MAQQLKCWESPRREGRNHKGRGGSARQRQKQKQLRALKQKLKQSVRINGKGNINLFPLFFYKFYKGSIRSLVQGSSADFGSVGFAKNAFCKKR